MITENTSGLMDMGRDGQRTLPQLGRVHFTPLFQELLVQSPLTTQGWGLQSTSPNTQCQVDPWPRTRNEIGKMNEIGSGFPHEKVQEFLMVCD